MKMKSLLTLFGLLTLLIITSCHKDTPTSYVNIQNNTFTDLSVTLNGRAVTIPTGSSLTFSARAGSAINGQALTSGGTLSAPVGATLSWDLSGYNFPPSGTEVIPIDVSTDFFYLTVKNISGIAVTKVDVNYGLTVEKIDNVSIPNDGYTYGVGYYDAFGNSNLKITLADNSIANWTSLNLPNTLDQEFPAVVQ